MVADCEPAATVTAPTTCATAGLVLVTVTGVVVAAGAGSSRTITLPWFASGWTRRPSDGADSTFTPTARAVTGAMTPASNGGPTTTVTSEVTPPAWSVNVAVPASPVVTGITASRLPGGMTTDAVTVATAGFDEVMVTGVSRPAGAGSSGNATDCAPFGATIIRPIVRTGVRVASAGSARTVTDFETGALTDATAHATPRVEVAVIVVAPTCAPLTMTVTSVWPAGMTTDVPTGDAIAGSTAASCTGRSAVSGAGRIRRSGAVPPTGTPSRRGLARSDAATGTTI